MSATIKNLVVLPNFGGPDQLHVSDTAPRLGTFSRVENFSEANAAFLQENAHEDGMWDYINTVVRAAYKLATENAPEFRACFSKQAKDFQKRHAEELREVCGRYIVATIALAVQTPAFK